MKITYSKQGGVLNTHLVCEINSDNRRQLTAEEAEELKRLLRRRRERADMAGNASDATNRFTYHITVEDASDIFGVQFSTGMYADDLALWRSVELIESLCYRACGLEVRPQGIPSGASSCCPEGGKKKIGGCSGGK